MNNLQFLDHPPPTTEEIYCLCLTGCGKIYFYMVQLHHSSAITTLEVTGSKNTYFLLILGTSLNFYS